MATSQISVQDSISKAKRLLSSEQQKEGVFFLHRLLLQLEDDSLERAEIYHTLSISYYRAGVLDSAIFHATKALDFRTATQKTSVNRARSLFVRAAAKRAYSHLFAAIQDLTYAITLLEKNQEEEGAVSRLPNMYLEAARIHKKLGNFDLSLLYAHKAKRAYQSLQTFSVSRQIAILEVEGAAYSDQGNREKASRSFRRALELAHTIDEPTPLKASSQNNLGFTKANTGEYAQADSLYREATTTYKACYKASPTPFFLQELAAVQANLAKLANQQGDHASVINQFVPDGLTYADKGFGKNKHPIKAELITAKGNAFLALGIYDKSLACFQDAFSILLLEPMLPLETESIENIVIFDRLQLLEVLNGKASVYKAQQKFTLAYSTYMLADALVDQIRKKALLQTDRSTLLRITRRMYEGAIDLCQSQCKENTSFCEKTYYFIAKNKAILLIEDIQASEALKYADLPISVMLEEEKLRQTFLKLEYDLQTAENNDDPRKTILQDRLNDAKSSYYALLQKLELSHPSYFTLKYALSSPLTIAQVQSHLSKGEIAIDYFLGEKYIYAAIISASTYKIKKWALPSSFQFLCLRFNTLLNEQNSQQAYLDVAHELYQVLIAPTLIKSRTPISKLTIIPDGLINLISVEALLTKAQKTWLGRANSYVIHQYAVRYLYSNLFLPPVQDSNIERVLQPYVGFGIEYDDFTLNELEKYVKKQGIDSLLVQRSIGKLYYSDDEVNAASSIFGGKAWLNQAATKEAFLTYGLNAQIIHFAMHGLVDARQPLNSALAFTKTNPDSDFLLRAGDLYGITLASDLGILSACQTASDFDPNNNGSLKSLAHAFTYAGCESLLASLWNASDKSSMDIVLAFLLNLKEGDTKELALQQSKLQYLEEVSPAFAHPYYWANLVLIGNTDALEENAKRWNLRSILIIISLIISSLILFMIYPKKRAA
ncbi:MAG: CHAT domain-containing tetratricopeptide repeat protein [Bacteroidota bacterium]